jgi:hypothetical protein
MIGPLPDIPAGQRDVDLNIQTTFASPTPVPIPGSAVSINNGTTTRNVIVTFSSDAIVGDIGDLLFYSVSVDGGGCFVSGPQALADRTTFDSHTLVSVFSLGPGVHTIQPCFRVVPDGDGNQGGSVGFRALTVEGRTR